MGVAVWGTTQQGLGLAFETRATCWMLLGEKQCDTLLGVEGSVLTLIFYFSSTELQRGQASQAVLVTTLSVCRVQVC